MGHDLNRGVTEFRRVTRTRPVSPEEDEALRSMADEEGGGRFDEQFDEQEPAAEPAAEQAAVAGRQRPGILGRVARAGDPPRSRRARASAWRRHLARGQ